MSKNDGGPAFPRSSGDTGPCDRPQYNYAQQGMSLRDWFAGMVVGGELASQIDSTMGPQYVAERAYKIADAMLAERDK